MKDTTKRRLLVTCACLYNVLYAGAFSGFGSMQLFLEETGAFHSKCIHNHTSVDTTEEEICSEQTNALVSVASYSLMTVLISPVLGQISDHFGRKLQLQRERISHQQQHLGFELLDLQVLDLYQQRKQRHR